MNIIINTRVIFVIIIAAFCVTTSVQAESKEYVWDFDYNSRNSADVSYYERGFVIYKDSSATVGPGFSNSNITGDKGWSQAAVAADFDSDGDLDIYVANGLNSGNQNRLWVNQGGDQGGTEGEFLANDISGDTSDSRAVAVGDVDSDGDLDIYVANYNFYGIQNKLWINQGGDQGGTEGEFQAGINASYSLSDTPKAIDDTDIDNDGDIDFYIVGTQLTKSDVMINQGGDQGGTEGEFEHQRITTVGASASSGGLIVSDFNGDEKFDIYMVTSSQNSLLLQSGYSSEGVSITSCNDCRQGLFSGTITGFDYELGPGNEGEVTFTVAQDDEFNYYWDGDSWETTDGDESSTAKEIDQYINLLGFDIERFSWVANFNSDDGSQAVELDSVKVTYFDPVTGGTLPSRIYSRSNGSKQFDDQSKLISTQTVDDNLSDDKEYYELDAEERKEVVNKIFSSSLQNKIKIILIKLIFRI